MPRGRKRRNFLSREELLVQSERTRRQDIQVRAMEQQRNTEAHQIVRLDPEYRAMEQQRNTDAHYRHHLNNLSRCLLEKCGIGAARDTKYFRESDFPET